MGVSTDHERAITVTRYGVVLTRITLLTITVRDAISTVASVSFTITVTVALIIGDVCTLVERVADRVSVSVDRA